VDINHQRNGQNIVESLQVAWLIEFVIS
jgi:hypothetical protein